MSKITSQNEAKRYSLLKSLDIPWTPLVKNSFGFPESRTSNILICLLLIPQIMEFLSYHFKEWTISFWANSYKGFTLLVLDSLFEKVCEDLCTSWELVPVCAKSQTKTEESLLCRSKPEASYEIAKQSKWIIKTCSLFTHQIVIHFVEI